MLFIVLVYSIVRICINGVAATPLGNYSNPGDADLHSLNGIEKRDVEYFGQSDSRPELTLISTQKVEHPNIQPVHPGWDPISDKPLRRREPGNIPGSLKSPKRGYVFPRKAGKGIYVYHIGKVRYHRRMVYVHLLIFKPGPSRKSWKGKG